MGRSMFVDENEQEVTIDGFRQTAVIRPLSAQQQLEAWPYTAVHEGFGHMQSVRKPDSKNTVATVNYGLVRIGDRTEDDWSKVLDKKALQAISDAIWRITE